MLCAPDAGSVAGSPPPTHPSPDAVGMSGMEGEEEVLRRFSAGPCVAASARRETSGAPWARHLLSGLNGLNRHDFTAKNASRSLDDEL